MSAKDPNLKMCMDLKMWYQWNGKNIKTGRNLKAFDKIEKYSNANKNSDKQL